MTNKTFKAGDAVQLLTGGAVMTVDYKTKEGFYQCKWQEESVWKTADFALDQLQPVDRKLRSKLL